MVAALDKAGVQVHVHAIGDGAVRNTLNALRTRSRRTASAPTAATP